MNKSYSDTAYTGFLVLLALVCSPFIIVGLLLTVPLWLLGWAANRVFSLTDPARRQTESLHI